MKVMGTMKHEQIMETLIGALGFEILHNQGVGGIRFVTMRYIGWGVVKNGKFGCYIIIE